MEQHWEVQQGSQRWHVGIKLQFVKQGLWLYLGVVSTTASVVHVKGTLGVLAVRPFALSAPAVCLVRGSVHGSLHNVATLRALQQSTTRLLWPIVQSCITLQSRSHALHACAIVIFSCDLASCQCQGLDMLALYFDHVSACPVLVSPSSGRLVA